MSKTKPTAAETILVLKAKINVLETQVEAKTAMALEYTERLRDFAERTRVLREQIADADSAYSAEQLRANELEADLRRAYGWADQTSAQHFLELKEVIDAAHNQKVWNIAFGVVAGFIAAWLIWA